MTVRVRLVTPEREVWSGQADMVIARGTDGAVGILAGHAPLLIRLAIGPLRIIGEGEQQYTVVDGGFLHVSTEEGRTRIDVLAAHAELASEIDLRAAEFRAEEARRRLAHSSDAAAQAELAKALARIDLKR